MAYIYSAVKSICLFKLELTRLPDILLDIDNQSKYKIFMTSFIK